MDAKQIEALAKQAEQDGDVSTAIVLYTLAASKYTGTDRELAHLMAEVAAATHDELKYVDWLDKG